MDFAQRTIDLARRNVEEGGRPFATVIVKDGAILAESPNKVAQTSDPTAHAEILAIRDACTTLGTEHLAEAERLLELSGLLDACRFQAGWRAEKQEQELVIVANR